MTTFYPALQEVQHIEMISYISNTDLTEELAYSNSESNLEAIVSQGLIIYLNEMRIEKKYKEFTKVFTIAFSDEINNAMFITYIAKNLMKKPSYLLSRLSTWT